MQYFRKKNVSTYCNIESKKFTIIVIMYIKKKKQIMKYSL